MDVRKIKLVAGYEATLVCRSFVFWVLCLLALAGVTYLQYLVQCYDPYVNVLWDWAMHHQSFSFPLVNAYLYNIVQAFLLIFVVMEVFFRQQQRGPLEALHVRSVSNGENLWGKVCGVWLVFVLVGGCSLLISAGLNIWGTSYAPFQPLYYLYYFLTLTLPSLVFFTGLAVWVTWCTRSRQLALLLLLVFLYFSVTRLPRVAHGLFDFTGSGLSNVFSAATGHVDAGNYALHRLAYLLAGVGFVCWTVRLQHRLPNARRNANAFLAGGIAWVLLGILCLGCVLQGYRAEQQVRETFRAAFARHAEVPACRVTSHDIVLQQQGNALLATSELTVRNPNGRDLPRFLLYLNPGLEVKRLEAAGQPIDFRREAQVIVVERPLRAGDSLRLKMHYEGTLDERLGYLDVEQASYEDTRRGNVFFHFGRRYAIVEQSALVLPPGLLWYPAAVPPENPSRPFFSERDYTCFRLCVAQPLQPVLISQGRAERRGDTLFFEQTYPLEGLSLCGGDYEQQSFHLGKIEVEWYHFKGDDCVSLFLEGVDKNELVKKMEEDILKKRRIYSGQLIDVMKRCDWLDGQDGCLRLVETPLAFNAPFRAWKNRSERIQPGMVFFGEGGIGAFSRMLSYPAFLRDRESKYGPSVRFVGNFLMEKDVVSSYHPFLRALKLYEANTGEENHYFPYNFNTLFFEPEACVVSARYEGIDRVLKLMMELERISGGLDLSETMVKAFMYLREHTLNEALRDRTISFDLQKQILAIKMQELESQLMEFASQRDLVDFLTAFYRTHRGEVSLDTLCKAMRKELNVDFEAVLRDWEVKRGASFQVEDFRFGRMKGQPYQVAAFKIRNVGEKAGRISGDFGYGGSYSLMLQPGECKEVRWAGNSNAFLLNLGVSRNIPANMHYVDNRSQGDVMDTLTGVFDIPASVFDLSEGEIVVDNEDPGFRLIVPPSRKLYRCFFEEKPYSEIYRGISRRMKRWGKVYNFNYYGKEIRSVYVKTAATGQYKAEWSAELPEEGTYEILVMHPNARFAIGVVELFYTVSGDGADNQVVSRDFERGEWVSLGEFHFQRGKSTVVLSDRAVDKRKEQERRFGPPYIVADAVKWRRVK